jgi:hypothetical protein
LAGTSQRIQAPKSWIGSETVNTLELMVELLAIVGDMNSAIATHVHPPLAPPASSTLFQTFSQSAKRLEALQRTITL